MHKVVKLVYELTKDSGRMFSMHDVITNKPYNISFGGMSHLMEEER